MEPNTEENQIVNGQLPVGELVEDPQMEQLSRFVAEKLLEISDHKKPEMFSREDILGNIQLWEKTKLIRLHQLQKSCERLGLLTAMNYFQREEKKILGFSRSVRGFQQRVIRSAFSGNSKEEPDEQRSFGFMPKWKWKK